MANTLGKLKVFLCHASENKPIIEGLFERLIASGFDPWLDSEVLLPGMAWDMVIQKALHESEAVIVGLSKISVAKEGYIQKEIKFAQDIQDEKPSGTIFLIPLRLDDCEIPFDLRDIQWGDYSAPDGYEKLVRALNVRAKQLGKNIGNAAPSRKPVRSAGKSSQVKEKKESGIPQIHAGDGSVIIVGNVNGSNISSIGQGQTDDKKQSGK